MLRRKFCREKLGSVVLTRVVGEGDQRQVTFCSQLAFCMRVLGLALLATKNSQAKLVRFTTS